jgi:hypothetical protein
MDLEAAAVIADAQAEGNVFVEGGAFGGGFLVGQLAPPLDGDHLPSGLGALPDDFRAEGSRNNVTNPLKVCHRGPPYTANGDLESNLGARFGDLISSVKFSRFNSLVEPARSSTLQTIVQSRQRMSTFGRRFASGSESSCIQSGQGGLMSGNVNNLAEKIGALSPEQIAAVEEFVESLRTYGLDRAITRAAAQSSAPSFEAIWNNPEDEAYDAL